MPWQHETLTAPIDEDRAGASQALGDDRRGIPAACNRRRMKLDEFRIGDDGPGARGNRHADAVGMRWIGRGGEQMADTAGREHDSARRDQQGRGRSILRAAQFQAAHDAVLRQQRIDDMVLDHADRGRRAHGVGQGRHDRLPGEVAADAQDALHGMGRRAGRRQLPPVIAIERDAEPDQILDPRRRISGELQRRSRLHQATPSRDHVGGVSLRSVVGRNGRRDVGLHGRAEGVLAERRCRDQRDRLRRELEGAEQSGNAGADDHDMAGRLDLVVVHLLSNSTFRAYVYGATC